MTAFKRALSVFSITGSRVARSARSSARFDAIAGWRISLILPPVLQLTFFGFALSATVSNVQLGRR